ncbi:MAG: hypothetical protein O3A92_01460 [Verrucomicrobia bacterium]|nr:hypothetical protein [Verrucomicrobiota bacterium]
MKTSSRIGRRQQDDQEAGLSFAWRVPGGSLGRVIAGVMVATGLFAAAASVLHVRVPLIAIPTREAAQVIALDDDDATSRELLDWARFQSPFPDRWDPPGTGSLRQEMESLTTALAESCAYQPRLLPQIEKPEDMTLPDLMEVELFPLPPTKVRPNRVIKGEVAKRVDAVSVARGPLKQRWGTRRIEWGGEKRAELVGIDATFTVGVTPEGRVNFCLSLEGLGSEIDEALKAWLRKQHLDADPDAGEMTLDVVVVRFEATNPEENPEIEER